MWRTRSGAPARTCAAAADSSSGCRRTRTSTTAGSSAAPASCRRASSAASVVSALVQRPLRRQRVEEIDRGQDPRAQRNLFAAQAVRIALAVPPLVVAVHERGDRVGKRHVRDDLGAHLRMHLHPLELLLGQRTGLRQDVLGHRQLADVVQQRRRPEALDLARRHAHRFRDARGIDLHAADLRRRGLILGVDGQRQRFDGGQVQVRQLPQPPLIVVHPLGSRRR